MERQARTVWGVGGERVERIGHGDHAGEVRNALAGQPVRIPLAVPALVVAADDRYQRRQVGDVLQQGRSLHRVRLHLLVFLHAQHPFGYGGMARCIGAALAS